ncbi:hypothetical protein OAH70_06845 [Flavobacteriaceae bacterium]|nr:hypothetical protein [Flavobacteriaceae bacterium]MDB4602187.1 hypothetical protein [Flavobacteriaceae bacterium]|tara:strand:+ start:302 stop:586 length:285 start_codon:yes stop_codon:yes gene_type:complete
MLKSIFNGILTTIKGIGLLGASIVMALLYGLFAIGVYWLLNFFTLLAINEEMITNEYLVEGARFIFFTHDETTQIVFVASFALLAIIKTLKREW